MFERFGPGARQALEEAEAQARSLGAPRVGPEHLVLGLLAAEGDTITVGWLRNQLGAASPATPRADARPLPYDDAVHAVLRRSYLISAELKAREVEAGHVLLALLEVAPPAAVAALDGLGVDVDALREETRDLLIQASRPALLPATAELDAMVEGCADPTAALAAAAGARFRGNRRARRAGKGAAGKASSGPGRRTQVAILAALVLVALAIAVPGRLVTKFQPTGSSHASEASPTTVAITHPPAPARHRPRTTVTKPGAPPAATIEAVPPPVAAPVGVASAPVPVVSMALAHASHRSRVRPQGIHLPAPPVAPPPPAPAVALPEPPPVAVAPQPALDPAPVMPPPPVVTPPVVTPPVVTPPVVMPPECFDADDHDGDPLDCDGGKSGRHERVSHQLDRKHDNGDGEHAETSEHSEHGEHAETSEHSEHGEHGETSEHSEHGEHGDD